MRGEESLTLFRNLVSGQVMPNLSYIFQKFSFQTVFFITNYHYCCCPCAYEHEYLEYIGDDGNINDEIYDRVEANIVRGRCPHVDRAPKLFATESAIYGIHIATVLRTNKIVIPKRKGNSFKERGERYTRLFNADEARGEIFQLNPFETALVKKRVSVEEYVKKDLRQGKLLYASRDLGNRRLLNVRPIQHVEIFLQRYNPTLLKSIVQKANFKDFPALFKLAVKNNLTELLSGLLQVAIKQNVSENILESMTKTAVVYDQPEVLRTILKGRRGHVSSVKLYCSALTRTRCETVLKECQAFVTEARPNTVQHRFTTLIDLLYEYYDDLMKDAWSLLLNFENSNWSLETCSLEKDLNHLEKGLPHAVLQSSVLEQFLTVSSIYCQRTNVQFQRVFRTILEMLVYANVGLRPLTSAVYIAIQRDADYHNASVEHGRLPHRKQSDGISFQTGKYQMDSKDHPLFWTESNNIALNFAGPLLIEAGYPFTKAELENASSKRMLHPAEYYYLRTRVITPRSLKTTCCHAIRRFYPGRKLHKVALLTPMAQPLICETRIIRDFILLNPSLTSLKSQGLKPLSTHIKTKTCTTINQRL